MGGNELTLRLAQATPPSSGGPTPQATTPPAAAPAAAADEQCQTGEIPVSTPEEFPELPWTTRPAPADLHARPLMPGLRWGFAGMLYWREQTGAIHGGGRIDVQFADLIPPILFQLPDFALNAPVGVFFMPRLEILATDEFTAVSGGFAVHLPYPDVASLYINLMGGAAMTYEDQNVHPWLNMDIGAQFRITGDNPLLIGFIEYNHQFLDPLVTNGITAGLRLRL